MSKYTSKAEAVITLNAKAAQDVTATLKKEIGLLSGMIQRAAKEGETALLKSYESRKKSLESAIAGVKKETMDFDKILRNLNGSSIRDLEKLAKNLRKQIKGLTPDTAEYIAKSNDLEKVRARLTQLNGTIRQTDSWVNRATGSFRKYWGAITAGIASLTGITFFFRSAAREANRMDDIYSDVMKTTGLLREDVVALNEDFKKMDTRTSRENLNNLARDAGKLGITGKENVLQFVQAANMIDVALGEDLGEGAIRNIGKMADVFQLTQKMGIEESYTRIGSAINALGQDSTASEAYLVDFTQRLAGVSAQMGLSIQDVLGFASAMDQSGQRVEMAATAFQTFLTKMYSNTATFAKYAKMEVKDFARLLETDANQAIMTVLTSLNESGGFETLLPIFKEMGADGARAISALSAMATNIEAVRKAQKLSNEEFAKGTSLLNEYEVKNNNAQAKQEKALKKWKDNIIELGEKVSPVFTKITSVGADFLRLLMSIPKELYVSIAIAGSAVAVWKSWNLVIGTWNSLVTTGKVLSLAWSFATAKLTGNAGRAAAAIRLMNGAMSASVIGITVTALVALSAGIYKVVSSSSALKKAQKELSVELGTAKFKAESLLSALETTSAGTQTYKDLIHKLSEDYGPYISHLVNEKGELTDIAKARTIINGQLENSIKLKLQEKYITEALEKGYKKMVKNEEGAVEFASVLFGDTMSEEVIRIKIKNVLEEVKSGAKDLDTALDDAGMQSNKLANFRTFLKRYVKAYKEMTAEITAIKEKFSIKQDPPANPDSSIPEGSKASNNNVGGYLPDEKTIKENFDKAIKALEKAEAQEQTKLKEMYLKRMLTQEGYQKKMDALTSDYLLKRYNLHVQFGQDTEKVESQFYDSLLSMQEKALKKAADTDAQIQKAIRDSINRHNKKEEENVPDDKYVTDVLNKAKKKEESLQEQALQIREKYSKKSRKEQNKAEMDNLNTLLERKMITEEEYEKAVGDMKLRNAIAITQSINNILSQAADFINQMKQAELDRLEADKERELTLYGDDADKRAEIENKYEKKKRDIQLRYADAEMGVKIAQTIAAGALAVMQAWAMNPLMGAIMAGIIGAVTLAQVATIIAQRNALRNGSGSSGSTGNAFTVTEGFYSGGYTGRDPSDRKEVGTVHANEWVAPARMVRANPVFFRELDRLRLNYINGVSFAGIGFASGGFTTPQDPDSFGDAAFPTSMMKMFIGALQDVSSELKKPRRSYVVNSEINAVNEINNRIKMEGSRK